MDATVSRSSRFRLRSIKAPTYHAHFIRNRFRRQDAFPHVLQSSYVLIAFDCLLIREELFWRICVIIRQTP